MKSMKISALVLGLAAAGVFAQTAEAPADSAAQSAPETAVQSAPETPAADSTAQSAAEAPKAAATDSVAAAPAAAPAADSAAAPAAAPAADSVAAAPAADSAAVAPAAEPANVAAAVPALAEDEKGPEFKVSGFVDLEANVLSYNKDRRFRHSYSSTFDLDFDVKFNNAWSAVVAVEGDGLEPYPDIYLNGAYVQYKNNLLAVKVGDMTYSEGAFTYYRFDDATYYAAGMKEQSLRGAELDILGIQFAVGFSANENTMNVRGSNMDDDQFAFFTHLAYDLDIMGQKFRPYVDYKGYDLDDGENGKTINKLRAGLFMNLSFMDLLDIHAGYGFLDDVVTRSEPVVSHTFLIEPILHKSIFSLTGSVFYALLADNPDRATVIDLPERFYIYAEPAIQFLDELKVGIMGEYHTNTLDNNNDANEFAYLGPKIYFNPSNYISMQFFGAIILPLDDGDGTGTIINFNQDDEFLFDMGGELIFRF